MWNIHGVIPPIADGEDGTSLHRSPYTINMLEFVKIFAFSSERVTILLNFLEYRQAIYHANITTGFQWVDGSFTEDVERIRERPPKDIDIVTFIHDNAIEPTEQWANDHLYLFDNTIVKENYQVDSYWINMDRNTKRQLIAQSAYWYSMWSHQRDTDYWKGFYSIELDPQTDILAKTWLTEQSGQTS